VLLGSEPLLSTDPYRYIWGGGAWGAPHEHVGKAPMAAEM
jgi:hypothetical protein